MMSASKSRRLVSDTAANDARKPRKNVGTACSACKSRKLKCTGEPPCDNCVKSRTECTLDETADKRRRGVLKRRIDELEDKDGLLARLLEFLRDNSERSTVPLLNLIRNYASPAEIRFYIEHELSRSHFTQVPDLLYADEVLEYNAYGSLPKRRVVGTNALDISRFHVPAQPWTSITDDEAVSRLISLWFTWVHPFCNFIDRDLFLRDMRSGSLTSQYCSPFLVNSILADACGYSEGRTPGPLDSLISKQGEFYEEAKRLLDKEEGRISLPTVQGIGVLWMYALITGRGRQVWLRGGQLAYSLRELSQASSGLPIATEPEAICMIRAVQHTHWGLFNLAVLDALFAKRAPIVRLPTVSFLVRSECYGDDWYPYPNQSKCVHSHTSCLFSAFCQLNQITYNLGPIYFTRPAASASCLEITSAQLDALEDLSEWPNRLPGCLKKGNVDVPHVLSLHVHYYFILIAVYGFLKIQPVALPVSPGTSGICNIITSPDKVREICMSSARKVAQFTLVHRSNWGSDHMPAADVPAMLAALYVLIEALDEPANRDAFASLMVAASPFTRQCDVTRTLVHGLKNFARQREVKMLPEIGTSLLELDQFSQRLSMLPQTSESPFTS